MPKLYMRTQLFGTNIEVSAKYIGARINRNWNYDSRPKYQMTVKNTDNGKEFTTTFWGSVNDLQTGRTKITEGLLENMLSSVILDAQSGDMSFDDFCFEFGYDNDDEKTENMYSACVETKENLESIFDGWVDLYVLYDDFAKYAVDRIFQFK